MFNDHDFTQAYRRALEGASVPEINFDAIHRRVKDPKAGAKGNWLPVFFGALLIPVAAFAVTQVDPRPGDIVVTTKGQPITVAHGSHSWFQGPAESFKRMKAADFHVVLPSDLPEPLRLEGVLGSDNRVFILEYAPYPFPTTREGFKKQHGRTVNLILQAATDPEQPGPHIGRKYSWVVGNERVTTYNPALTAFQIDAIKKGMRRRP